MKLLSILLLLMVSSACQSNSFKETQEKPNIVIILSDDQAWNDYSFMGHKYIQTPNIDKLAAEAVLFKRGYVPTGLCRPSLMTIMTGQYASIHGVTGNNPYGKSDNPNTTSVKEALISKIDKFDTIAELLGEQGYLSHQSGKWWEGNFKRGGFTHGMTRGYPQKNGRHGDDGLKIGREGMKPVSDFVQMAVAEKKPFFMWYAPFLPHTPHNPPQRLFDKYLKNKELPKTVARYYAMCEWFDETCGQLRSILDKNKVSDNTIIIYVCDNGWIQSPTSRRYAPRSKQTAYEAGVRTPIFFHYPKKFQATSRPELCSSLDILPTIVGLTGAKMPKGLPGLDLSKTCLSGASIKRDHIFGESFAHDILDISNPDETLVYRWCIQGKWKLLLTYDGIVRSYKSTHPRKEKRPQLFDLSADPHETKNLAAANPAIVAKMAKMVTDWHPSKARKVLTEFK